MFRRLLILTLLSLGLVGGAFRYSHAAAAGMTQSMPKPFFFTENKGQWDARVLYKCQAKNGMTWFLERDGITLLVSREQGIGNGEQGKDAAVRQTLLSDDPMERDLPEMLRRHPQRKYPMKGHALKFHFVKGEGSKVNGERATKNDSDNHDQTLSTQHPTPYTLNPSPDFLHPTPSTFHHATAQSIEAQGELPWHNNYFLGNDSSKWAPNCRNFSTVVYREVWDGIDIEWYENEGKLEFDFVVHPGFDPNQIRMSVEGLDSVLSLAGDGFWVMGSSKKIQSVNPTPNTQHSSPMTELLLPTSLGELRTALPSVYQVSANGTRTEIEATFQLTDENTFGIILPNGHDRENTLRIDPLVYSTYLGGTGEEWIRASTSDDNGGVIVTGYTSSINYPVTAGVGQNRNLGGWDCFVTRIDDTGYQLIYSTYLGGSSDDVAQGIDSDGAGGVFITGLTSSNSFPVTNGVFGPTHNGGGTYHEDCFVTHLNNMGSWLFYSTYLGGSGDEQAFSICSEGNSYVTVIGTTNSTNFPTTINSFDITYNGGTWLGDCFVTRLNNSGSQLIYSTFLGGSAADAGEDVFNDGNGGVFVTGVTTSSNFPTTVDAYDTSFNGGLSPIGGDCFVTHLNNTGSQIISSTFLGGSEAEGGTSFVSDGNGGVIVTGRTTSINFPTTTGSFDTSNNGGDCYVTNLNSSLSELNFSTFLGGAALDDGYGIARAINGNLFIVGRTFSDNFPCTAAAFDSTYNGGGTDCFVTELNGSGSQVIYSTFLGGSGVDYGFSVVNNNNNVIVTGYTSSIDFPTTIGTVDSTFNGGASDCFVTIFRFDSTDAANEIESVPLSYSLSQNYPNPFNSSTTISYSIPQSGAVYLRLFDITGREVATLVDRKQQTGSYRVIFDGENLSSGTYFVRLQAGGFMQTKKMILLK